MDASGFLILLIIALIGGLISLNRGKDGTKATGITDFTEPFFGIWRYFGILILLVIGLLISNC
jgi:hypothetical protein